MKSLIIIAVAVLLTLIADVLLAQDLVSNAEYRVTAFKQGDHQVYSISNEVQLGEIFTLYIPNAFTPNGDGLNETFGPVGQRVDYYSMVIFNRWGQLIFESNDINDQWDGTYKGERVQTDTYVYKIFATGEESGVFKKYGKITVVI